MVFWAMVLFVFGLVYLIDTFSPILSGFMKQVNAILVMMIAMGILYRDLYVRRKGLISEKKVDNKDNVAEKKEEKA